MAGILIVLMTFFAIVSDVSDQAIPIVVAGLFGWCAVLFLFTSLKLSQRWQTGLLTIAGISLILYSAQRTDITCLLYTSPSPRDGLLSRMPSSA